MIILSILSVFATPIALNFILLSRARTSVIGDETTWLMFWSNYASALITASVTLFVLYRQLVQNQKENDANREANNKANEQNRELQLNILSYQQEQDWLNQFRRVAAEYVALYSYNDLVDVANVARKDPYKAFYLVKDLFTRAGKADLNLAFIQRESNSFQKLNQDKTTLFVFYNQVLDELQILLSLRIDKPKISLKRGLSTVKGLSEDMLNIINQVIAECPNASITDQFNTAIMARIKLIETCEEKLRDWFYEYIHHEQLRINNILYTPNGTEQTK